MRDDGQQRMGMNIEVWTTSDPEAGCTGKLEICCSVRYNGTPVHMSAWNVNRCFHYTLALQWHVEENHIDDLFRFRKTLNKIGCSQGSQEASTPARRAEEVGGGDSCESLEDLFPTPRCWSPLGLESLKILRQRPQ